MKIFITFVALNLVQGLKYKRDEILTRACELYVVKQVQNDRIEYEVEIIEFGNELIWRFEKVSLTQNRT